MTEHDPRLSSEGFELLSHGGGATVVPDAGATPSRNRRRRLVTVGAVAALVVATGLGAVAVGAALGGGGAQPESVVPANAVFYAELDLDPAAGQKVDAYRFLRKFPALKDAFTADGGYGPAFAKIFDASGVDYARDVQPWLGKRFAVALVPGGSGGPRLMAVVQTTDDDLARADLDRLVRAKGLDGVSVAVSGGYVVLAGTVDPTAPVSGSDGDLAAELLAQAKTADLAGAPAYAAAVQPYGDAVATVWSDADGLSKALGSLYTGLGRPGATKAAASPTGQTVAVLRFDGDTLEVLGQTTGSQLALKSGGVPAVATLPDSTLVAVGANDLGTLLADAYGPVWQQLGSLALGRAPVGPHSDVPGPKNWPTLFGDQTLLAVGGGSSQPDIGARVVGGSDTVKAVLDAVRSAGLGSATVGRSEDGVVVASSKSWLDALVSGGSFGESATFQEAVPDWAEAGLVGFADIDGLVGQYGQEISAQDRANLTPLHAVGFSVGSQDGTTSFRLRLLTS
jgi:Protein of unknown function (DUF3352)